MVDGFLLRSGYLVAFDADVPGMIDHLKNAIIGESITPGGIQAQSDVGERRQRNRCGDRVRGEDDAAGDRSWSTIASTGTACATNSSR